MSYATHIAEAWLNTTPHPLTLQECAQLQQLARAYLEDQSRLQSAQDLASVQGRRAEFTRAALTGILANPTLSGATAETIAHSATSAADAALTELRGRPPSLEPLHVFESVYRARRARQLEAMAAHLWAKLDKFESCYSQAEQLLGILEATP